LEKPKVFGKLNGTLYFQNGKWLLLSNYNLGFQGVFGNVYCPLFKLLVVEGEMHDFFCSWNWLVIDPKIQRSWNEEVYYVLGLILLLLVAKMQEKMKRNAYPYWKICHTLLKLHDFVDSILNIIITQVK
jgi:hypothetical protein